MRLCSARRFTIILICLVAVRTENTLGDPSHHAEKIVATKTTDKSQRHNYRAEAVERCAGIKKFTVDEHEHNAACDKSQQRP